MRHLVRILGINRRILTFILLLLIKFMIIEGAIKVWKINCEDMNCFEVDAFLLVVLTLWFWYQEINSCGSSFSVTVQTVSSASDSRLVGKQWALSSERVSMLLEWTNTQWELWPHDGLESGKCPPSSCKFILNCIASCVSSQVALVRGQFRLGCLVIFILATMINLNLFYHFY